MVARPIPTSSTSATRTSELPSALASLDLNAAADADAASSLDLASGSRTILVLGASYGGLRAARMIAEGLTVDELAQGWHVVCVDRNSHFNRPSVPPKPRRGGRRPLSHEACELQG
jgi:hypothetical protein